MASDAPLAEIACPACDALYPSSNNYCGFCGAALSASDRYRDYERAVGSAILALNGLESEVFYLFDILGEATPLLERAFFKTKIKTLEEVAAKQADNEIRAKMEQIAREAHKLADDRNNFAHGLLWTDGFTGEHKRTYVRQRDGKVFEDERTPEEIERSALNILMLRHNVRDLAMQMGGLERWEKFCEEELEPLLALRDAKVCPPNRDVTVCAI
jgi:hypothetical protein